jgi:hypothetical protein
MGTGVEGSSTLERFTEKWTHPDYPSSPVTETELRLAEEKLSVRFPDDYRQGVIRFGLPRPTVDLLGAIVDQELDLHCLGDMYTPSEMTKYTLAAREDDLPGEFIAFAGDESGNLFCFDGGRLNAQAEDGGTIWFLDHDFGTLDAIAPSFTAWIDAFCEIDP